MWNLFLDVVFPRQCLGCGNFGQYICNNCAKAKIQYFVDQVCPYCEKPSLHGLTHPRCQKPSGLDGMFVLAHYRGLIPQLIHEVKYQGYHAELEEIVNLITDRYDFSFNFHYFVPVPLSASRERKRGFNQAEKLAQQLYKVFSIQYSATKVKAVANLLIRARDTRPQFELKFAERKTNLKDAFTLSPKLLNNNLNDLSFCLVDDVATTGATLFECTKVLKKAGAKNVYAITIARGG